MMTTKYTYVFCVFILSSVKAIYNIIPFWDSHAIQTKGHVDKNSKRLGGHKKIKVIVKLCVFLLVLPDTLQQFDKKRGNT